MTSTFFDTFITKDNATPGYERFYYTKRYIAAKSKAVTGKDARRRIGEALGYNLEKSNFAQRLDHQRRRYDAMDKRVPYAYLEQIGVKWDELETCLEADQELFHEEAEKPRYPQYAVVRYMAAFYGRITFPEHTPEEEAIRSLGAGKIRGLSKLIVYPELLMILVAPGEDPSARYLWYPPEVRYGKKDLLIEALPRGMGVTRVR